MIGKVKPLVDYIIYLSMKDSTFVPKFNFVHKIFWKQPHKFSTKDDLSKLIIIAPKV